MELKKNSVELASVPDILNAISNDKAFLLFKTIALANAGNMSVSKLELTRKQYYSIMSGLIKAGLVKRKNRKYFLTALGKIVYCAQLITENALNNYWKLKAIDSLEMSDEISKEELTKLADTLIENKQIKEFLATKECS